jgi:Hint domain/Subtilase family
MAGPGHKDHFLLDDWLTDPTSLDSFADPGLTGPIETHHAGFVAAIQPYAITLAATPTPVSAAQDVIGVPGDTPIVFDGLITNGGSGGATIVADDKSDIAMGGSLARSEFSVDGTGIKIGILSDSFNVKGGETADITAGNLPPASDIKILKEGPATGNDEGRAMAELIHRVAPGASIDFYTAVDSESDFAAGIGSLVADGCNIIVDDVSYFDEPFFQDGSTIDVAVENAVNHDVSYFTAAGNEANDFYQRDWISNTFTLPTFGKQTAFDFGVANGGTSSPYETFTVNSGFTGNIELQWDQPFASIGSGTGSDDALRVDVFQNGTLSFATGSTIGTDPSIGLQFTPGTYEIAITLTSGPAPDLIKMINFDDAGTAGGGFVGGASVGSGSIAGHALVPGANTVGAVNYINTPAFGHTLTLESFSSVGSGEFLFNSSGTRLASPEVLNKVNFTAPDGSTTSVFNPFLGTSAAAPDAAAVAALMLQANPALTPALITSDLESTALSMSGGTAAVGAGFIQAVPAVQLAKNQGGQTACYLAGTRILTPSGPVPIERLSIGDEVVTLSGTLPVRWIGRRRIDIARHPSPELARPICIRRGAFADNVPRRDLRVSPEHALYVDGALIPARLLVNGDSIVEDDTLRHVHYYHLELLRHAVIFAEGLAAESWLDTGNRFMFDNATEPSSHRSAKMAWQHDACAPLVDDTHRIRFIRQRLTDRARTLRLPHLVAGPNLHLAIGDTIVWPVREDTHRYVFVLPRHNGLAQLRSRILSPTADQRMLGVSVTRIVSHGADRATDIALDADALRDGWWDVERDANAQWRWTDGDAALALPAGAEFLQVHLAGSLRYAVADTMKAAA